MTFSSMFRIVIFERSLKITNICTCVIYLYPIISIMINTLFWWFIFCDLTENNFIEWRLLHGDVK